MVCDAWISEGPEENGWESRIVACPGPGRSFCGIILSYPFPFSLNLCRAHVWHPNPITCRQTDIWYQVMISLIQILQWLCFPNCLNRQQENINIKTGKERVTVQQTGQQNFIWLCPGMSFSTHLAGSVILAKETRKSTHWIADMIQSVIYNSPSDVIVNPSTWEVEAKRLYIQGQPVV